MKSKKGISDVVTTVIIVALALVAITVVWVVIQGLITSNTGVARNQQTCLESRFTVSGKKGANNKVTVTAMRESGSTDLEGVILYVYSDTGSDSEDKIGNVNVGGVVSAELELENAIKVSAVPYFKSGATNHSCDPIVVDITG